MHDSEIARLAEALSALASESPSAREAMAAMGSLLNQIAGGAGSSSAYPRRVAGSFAGGRYAPFTGGGSHTDDRASSSFAPDPAGANERTWESRTNVSLEHVAERCRLKAEACRWAIQRRRLLEEGDGFDEHVAPRDAEFIERAGAIENCYIWTMDAYAQLPDDSHLEIIAGNYEGLAVAVETMQEIDELTHDRELQQEAMQAVAASQSSLRQALFDVGRKQRDADQEEAFHWLKEQTGARRIYVSRHMRLMDPADPRHWAERVEAAETLVERIAEVNERAGVVKTHLSRIRSHAERLDAGEGDRHDWERIDESVKSLLEESGVLATDEDLCEALELAIDTPMDGFEPGPALQLALTATENWLDSFEDEDDEDAEDAEDAEDDGEEEWEEEDRAAAPNPEEKHLA